jgi:hypothetical protein
MQSCTQADLRLQVSTAFAVKPDGTQGEVASQSDPRYTCNNCRTTFVDGTYALNHLNNDSALAGVASEVSAIEADSTPAATV